MSLLSSTILNMAARGASATAKPPKDRSFVFDLPGAIPDVTFCQGTCPNAQDLDTKTGGGKWMYDQAARSFGYDPVIARRTPDQNDKVELRMYITINDAIAAVKARGGKSSSVEWHSQFRSSLSAERNKTEQAETLKLNEQARLASLPGASTLANPTVRGAVQRLINIEINALKMFKPDLAVASQATLLAGGTAALIAAENLDVIRAIPDQLDNDAAENKLDQKPLTALALPLDTNKDGKLFCKEIGDWKTDNANHTANSRAYQDYVSGRPGTDFRVKVPAYNAINFDGCKDKPEGPVLLEAKAKQGSLLDPKPLDFMPAKIAKQGQSQHNVATALGVANEWHVQTVKDHAVIKGVLNDDTNLPTPVIYDPTPVIKNE